MRATLRKWGNSLALRIPQNLADDASLREGTELELRLTKRGIEIRPVVTLAEMLAQVTPLNLHDEEDFGAPIGREAL